MLRKKLPWNWRNETKVGRIQLAAWSGITNSESTTGWSLKITRTIGVYWRLEKFPRSWLTEQFWQCPRSAPSSYHLEFQKAQPRIENAAKYTGGYKYYWKRFWLSTCPTSAWETAQWFKRNWEKWKRRTIAINTLTLLFGKSKGKKSRRQKIVLCLWPTMPRVLGVVLKVAWQFRVILPRRCIWGNSMTIRNFKAGL